MDRRIGKYKVLPPLPDWWSNYQMASWAVRQALGKSLSSSYHKRIGDRKFKK
jgi:hypothetical protein